MKQLWNKVKGFVIRSLINLAMRMIDSLQAVVEEWLDKNYPSDPDEE